MISPAIIHWPKWVTFLHHSPSCRPLRLFYRETVVISGNLGSTIWKRILKAGWNATNVAPKQCFYVAQDQKTRVFVHSWQFNWLWKERTFYPDLTLIVVVNLACLNPFNANSDQGKIKKKKKCDRPIVRSSQMASCRLILYPLYKTRTVGLARSDALWSQRKDKRKKVTFSMCSF